MVSGRVSARASIKVISDLKGVGAELTLSEAPGNHCVRWSPGCEMSDIC